MTDDSSLHLSDPLPFPRQFGSRVDWWLGLLLVLPLVITAALVATRVAPPWVLMVVALPQIVAVWMLVRTDYTIDETTVVARCGPFRTSIPVSSIRTLTATRNPLSSPALSLDRIAINHAGGTLMISPRNKAGFTRAVLAVAPGITVTGLPEATAPDTPESAFNTAAVVPLVLLAVAGLAFGAWQLYVGLQPPRATIDGNVLSIEGLYSTTLYRSDVVRVTLQPTVTVVRKVSGFDGGRRLRGIFELDTLGESRVFVTRGSSPVLVLHTRTQPVVLAFDDPAATEALAADLREAWHLAP